MASVNKTTILALLSHIIPGSFVAAKCYLVNGKRDTISSKKTNALKFN